MARGIIFKDNGINGLSNSPSGYKYVGYDGQVISEKSGSTVSAIGGGLPYSSYVSKLYQTGTGNPTASELQNDTVIVSSNWVRGDVGDYYLDQVLPYADEKVIVLVGNNAAGGSSLRTYGSYYGGGYLYLQSFDETGAKADSLISPNKLDIEFRVYP